MTRSVPLAVYVYRVKLPSVMSGGVAVGSSKAVTLKVYVPVVCAKNVVVSGCPEPLLSTKRTWLPLGSMTVIWPSSGLSPGVVGLAAGSRSR